MRSARQRRPGGSGSTWIRCTDGGAAGAAVGAVGGRSEGELAAETESLRKQLRQARQDVEILQEALGFLPRAGGLGPRGKHSFIRAHLGRWLVSVMCRALGVSQQGYYRAIRWPEPGWRDRQLLEQIYTCLREDEENGGNYGVRRILAWLWLHRGYTGGSRRVYRVCREHHLTIRPRYRSNGVTRADRQAEKSEDLIKRDFAAAKPNKSF